MRDMQRIELPNLNSKNDLILAQQLALGSVARLAFDWIHNSLRLDLKGCAVQKRVLQGFSYRLQILQNEEEDCSLVTLLSFQSITYGPFLTARLEEIQDRTLSRKLIFGTESFQRSQMFRLGEGSLPLLKIGLSIAKP